VLEKLLDALGPESVSTEEAQRLLCSQDVFREGKLAGYLVRPGR
jgi:hypothetical protein